MPDYNTTCDVYGCEKQAITVKEYDDGAYCALLCSDDSDAPKIAVRARKT
jgi:hypothetical protein